MTHLTHNQLATILSAIDGKRRNPNTRATAIAQIARRAEKYMITSTYLLSAAEGLLDGRLDAEAFRRELEVGYQPEPEPEPAPEPAPEPKANGGKQALIIEMMRRPEGATIAEMAEATGWQQHSVRGLLSVKISKQHAITKTRRERCRVYRIASD
jgi:hypothetical protein